VAVLVAGHLHRDIALSVNFIGDGLRDAFDPRQQRVRD
jgi:ABC-type dipeptide/oligopeptide/nickel transport system permease subunit